MVGFLCNFIDLSFKLCHLKLNGCSISIIVSTSSRLDGKFSHALQDITHITQGTFGSLSQRYCVIHVANSLGHAANFYYMLTEEEPSPSVTRVLDACLILHAEHTMNASTFSGRVTGSTLANPYTVVSSAIGTLTGPLHGGANEEVLDMLEEIGSQANVKAWLDDAIKHKKKIMGFGHRVYKVKDPRATVLQELAEQMFVETGKPEVYKLAVEMETIASGVLGPNGIYPNVDFYSGIILKAMGIPTHMFTVLFAVARTVGWVSQWKELVEDPSQRIGRPRQVYSGAAERPFVPMALRP